MPISDKYKEYLRKKKLEEYAGLASSENINKLSGEKLQEAYDYNQQAEDTKAGSADIFSGLAKIGEIVGKGLGGAYGKNEALMQSAIDAGKDYELPSQARKNKLLEKEKLSLEDYQKLAKLGSDIKESNARSDYFNRNKNLKTKASEDEISFYNLKEQKRKQAEKYDISSEDLSKYNTYLDALRYDKNNPEASYQQLSTVDLGIKEKSGVKNFLNSVLNRIKGQQNFGSTYESPEENKVILPPPSPENNENELIAIMNKYKIPKPQAIILQENLRKQNFKK